MVKRLSIITAVSMLLYNTFFQFAFPTEIFLLIAMATLVLLMNRGVLWIKRDHVKYLVFMAMVFGGCFYTSNLEDGILQSVTWFCFVLFILIGSKVTDIQDYAKRFILIFSYIIMCSVYVQLLFPEPFLSCMRKIMNAASYEQFYKAYLIRAYVGIGAYSPVTSWAAGVVFGDCLYGMYCKDSKGKFMRIVMMMVAFYAIMLTSKRGVFLATLIAAFVLVSLEEVWGSPFRRGQYVKKFFVFFLLLIGTIASFLVLMESNDAFARFMLRFTGDDITNGRMRIYARAFAAMNHYLVGEGTGAAYLVYPTGLHNIYLQIFYDHGLVGLAFVLYIFVSNFLNAVKKKDGMSVFIQILFLAYGMSGNPMHTNPFFINYLIFSQAERVTTR